MNNPPATATAVPTTTTFYGGLVLIVLGTGLLKPNVSAVVADLYPEGGAARDAGFAVGFLISAWVYNNRSDPDEDDKT